MRERVPRVVAADATAPARVRRPATAAAPSPVGDLSTSTFAVMPFPATTRIHPAAGTVIRRVRMKVEPSKAKGRRDRSRKKGGVKAERQRARDRKRATDDVDTLPQRDPADERRSAGGAGHAGGWWSDPMNPPPQPSREFPGPEDDQESEEIEQERLEQEEQERQEAEERAERERREREERDRLERERKDAEERDRLKRERKDAEEKAAQADRERKAVEAAAQAEREEHELRATKSYNDGTPPEGKAVATQVLAALERGIALVDVKEQQFLMSAIATARTALAKPRGIWAPLVAKAQQKFAESGVAAVAQAKESKERELKPHRDRARDSAKQALAAADALRKGNAKGQAAEIAAELHDAATALEKESAADSSLPDVSTCESIVSRAEGVIRHVDGARHDFELFDIVAGTAAERTKQVRLLRTTGQRDSDLRTLMAKVSPDGGPKRASQLVELLNVAVPAPQIGIAGLTTLLRTDRDPELLVKAIALALAAPLPIVGVNDTQYQRIADLSAPFKVIDLHWFTGMDLPTLTALQPCFAPLDFCALAEAKVPVASLRRLLAQGARPTRLKFYLTKKRFGVLTNFCGITDAAWVHVVRHGEYNKAQNVISGAHSETRFNLVVRDLGLLGVGCNIDRTRVDGDVKRITYTLTPAEGRPKQSVKTVIPGLAADSATWRAEAETAAWDAFNRGKVGNYAWNGEANGRKWTGLHNNGVMTTAYLNLDDDT